MLGGGGMATVQAPFSNTRCRQMVSKILIFWKWVLPWLCLISAFQTPTSYKWNDTGPFAFYAVNRVLRFGFWQSKFGFQIVKVPVFRHNNLLQNPTYCKIQPTSPYSKLFIYCQKYIPNIKMLQSLCSQSTCIPHNCHFFYTGKIFGEWNLHQKTGKLRQFFCVKSVKVYTDQNKFTRAPPAAPVTIMRYAQYTNSSPRNTQLSQLDLVNPFLHTLAFLPSHPGLDVPLSITFACQQIHCSYLEDWWDS